MNTKHATTNFKMLMPFIAAVNANNGYLKCTSDGYMDLNFDNMYYTDKNGFPVYSMAHNTVQNGDLMADPDMTFSVDYVNGRIIPLTYQNDFMGVYQEVFINENGKHLYRPQLWRDLDSFLWQWLKNIEAQGFKPEL